jgi:hypothetical protein
MIETCPVIRMKERNSVATKSKSTNGKPTGKKRTLRAWSKEDHRELRGHSKAKTAVVKISRAMKRTAGALRQQARKLGIPLGHRR